VSKKGREKKNQWTLTFRLSLSHENSFYALKEWKKQVESIHNTHIIPKVPFLHFISLYLKKLSEELHTINFGIYRWEAKKCNLIPMNNFRDLISTQLLWGGVFEFFFLRKEGKKLSTHISCISKASGQKMGI
jgi:hypothetical protein